MAKRHFHDELHDLEIKMLAMGGDVQAQVGLALKGLIEDESHLFSKVVEGDDLIDTYYLEIERTVVDLFALQTPVASDLRLLTVLLHINLHLERVADMAVNMAKIGALAEELPRNDSVLTHLQEMGGIALKMIGATMDAFARRDLDLCLELPRMDDPIDRLNRGMLQEVLAISDDKRLLEWGIRMHVVSRQIERIGDHAVDIAEQVAYLITGEFREFTDASHPQGAD
ncbi:MAG: phosphate signaling complex protein PhoU [Actinomycetota bacterium]